MASGDTLATFAPLDATLPSTAFATWKGFANGDLALAFTAGNADVAFFRGIMPRTYGGGGITAYVHWATVSVNTGTGGFDVTFERGNDANHSLGTDALATAQVITAVSVPGTAGQYKTTSVAITAGAAGTDSIAAGDPFRMRLRRLSSDTAVDTIRVTAIELKET